MKNLEALNTFHGCAACALCGEVGTDFLSVHGKHVCPGCFTALYIQSMERSARILESRWLGDGESIRVS